MVRHKNSFTHFNNVWNWSVWKKILDLINKIWNQRTKHLIDELQEMRLDISKRVDELENYFDENFCNYRMNILQKGIFQLKKLLFYNHDNSNEQKETDLPEFWGLVMNFDLINKLIFLNQNFLKKMDQNNKKISGNSKLKNDKEND